MCGAWACEQRAWHRSTVVFRVGGGRPRRAAPHLQHVEHLGGLGEEEHTVSVGSQAAQQAVERGKLGRRVHQMLALDKGLRLRAIE